MKIISYNLWVGGTTDNKNKDNLTSIINTLESLHPDLVVLQEANHFEQDCLEPLHFLGRQLGLDHRVLSEATMRGSGNQYHTALLCRYPVEVTPFKGMHHSAFISNVAYPSGPFTLAGAHLCPSSEQTRTEEIEKILSLYPDLVIGDFNMINPVDSYESDLAALKAKNLFVENGKICTQAYDSISQRGYKDVALTLNKEPERTFPTPASPYASDGLTFRLDYAFCRPGFLPRVKSFHVVKNPLSEQASDHFPIVIEIQP